MKVEVAGVAIDVPRTTVVILDDDVAQPVYHASAEGGREGCSWWIRRTACGRMIFAQQDDGREERHGFELATRHALKFARPCATCWPELRVQLALFGRRRRPGLERTPAPVQEPLS